MMLPPPPPQSGFPPGALFPPQATILPHNMPVLAAPPFQTVVCFPYASLSPAMDPWHHRIHAPASCMADVGLHATATFGLIERPMDSPNDVDQRQQLLPLQAANN